MTRIIDNHLYRISFQRFGAKVPDSLCTQTFSIRTWLYKWVDLTWTFIRTCPDYIPPCHQVKDAPADSGHGEPPADWDQH